MMVVMVIAVSACDTDDYTGDSTFVPTSPSVMIDAPTVPPSFDYGAGGTFTFDIALSETQIVDVKVAAIGSGDAVEGVDYTVSENLVVINAHQTEASKQIVLTIMSDAVRDADRTLTFTIGDYRTSNASLTPSVTTITLKKSPENVLNPPPAQTTDFMLRWEFTSELMKDEEVCDYIDDMDFTIQPLGGAPYDGTDLLGYSMATGSCPEEGGISLGDMVDGAVYDVWFIIFGDTDLDIGEHAQLTVYLDYNRPYSDFAGTLEIEGLFSAEMSGLGYILLKLSLSGDVLTLSDTAGNEIGQGKFESTDPINVEKQ